MMRRLLIAVIVCCSLVQRVTMLGSKHVRQAEQDVCLDSEANRLEDATLCLQDVYQIYVENLDTCFGSSVEQQTGRCGIHESGVLCLELEDSKDPDDIERECITNGGFDPVNGTCTNACRVEILTFSNALGCCGNSLYNYTSSRFVEETSYELWSACGVTSPGFCDTNVTFTPPSQPPTECEYWDRVCSEEFRDLFFDPGEDCIDSVSTLEFCGIDENGEFCQRHPVQLNHGDSLAEAVDGNCTTYGQICPIECRRALNEFREGLGCCLNNLYSFDDEFNHTVRPELWSWCGVDLPDFCNSTFTINTEQSTPATDSDDDDDTITIVLVAVIVVLVLLLVLTSFPIVCLIWRNQKLQKNRKGRRPQYETTQQEAPQMNAEVYETIDHRYSRSQITASLPAIIEPSGETQIAQQKATPTRNPPAENPTNEEEYMYVAMDNPRFSFIHDPTNDPVYVGPVNDTNPPPPVPDRRRQNQGPQTIPTEATPTRNSPTKNPTNNEEYMYVTMEKPRFSFVHDPTNDPVYVGPGCNDTERRPISQTTGLTATDPNQSLMLSEYLEMQPPGEDYVTLQMGGDDEESSQ